MYNSIKKSFNQIDSLGLQCKLLYNECIKNITHKIILLRIIAIIIIFSFGNFAHAQTTSSHRHVRTYDTQYQAQDSGRSRVNSASRNEINDLNDQSVVKNLRIPILLGVKVSDLEDTWGDARSNGRTHEGIDILVPRGSLIVSPTDAVVTTVENSGNGGNHVFTANPGGERYYFAHLDHFAEGLKEGDILKAGDLIGYVGNTGNASGGPTHLHFGIYQDDRNGATNPFPRLTREFSLQDRMDAVTKFLDESTDSSTLAQTLVNQYQSTFLEAKASGITLPTIINKFLTEKKTDALGISRILKIGMNGDDVKWLQSALGISADGTFGPKTQAAVIAFQIKKGLTADGVFGPKSRAVLADSSLIDIIRPAGCTATSAYSTTTGAKCL